MFQWMNLSNNNEGVFSMTREFFRKVLAMREYVTRKYVYKVCKHNNLVKIVRFSKDGNGYKIVAVY